MIITPVAIFVGHTIQGVQRGWKSWKRGLFQKWAGKAGKQYVFLTAKAGKAGILIFTIY